MSDPLISVVVSTYAGERRIRRCLEILEGQTVSDRLEILVIDSGSPEDERSIVAEMCGAYDNIVYVRTARETLYAAWNRALAIARGTYFANFNVDDWIRDDALELLMLGLEHHRDADIAYSHWAATTLAQQPPTANDPISFHPQYVPALPLFYCYGGSTQFWRRSSLLKLGGFNETYVACGDLDALYRLAVAGGNAVLVPHVLEGFFQNPDGLSRATDDAVREQAEIFDHARRFTPVEALFAIDPNDSAELASAWTALGNLAMQIRVPWHDEALRDASFALQCYERALDSHPTYRAALHNRMVVLHDEGRWGDADESLGHLDAGEAAHVRGSGLALLAPDVEPARRGAVYEATPTAELWPLTGRTGRVRPPDPIAEELLRAKEYIASLEQHLQAGRDEMVAAKRYIASLESHARVDRGQDPSAL
jgi:tetratricopeptide (TPR) repeat protein